MGGEKQGRGKKGKKQMTRSKKAGLLFPVGRVHRKLRNGKYADRYGIGAPVYLAAVMEYVAAEILEQAVGNAKADKKKRIIPRHVQLAVRRDSDLNTLLSKVTVSGGGVMESDVLKKK